MIIYIKFVCLYFVSHQHYLAINRITKRQNKIIHDDRKTKKFVRLCKKFSWHVRCFDAIQIKLDKIKDETIEKYQDLAD